MQLQEEYVRLGQAAQRHKTEARFHRNAARKCRQQQAALAERCEALGIRIEEEANASVE